HKPLTVAAGFYSHQRRLRHAAIKLLGLAIAVDQLALARFSRRGVQPRHLLPAGMKITSYNPHRRLLPSPASFLVLYRKRRLRIGASLRPYPINPFAAFAKGWEFLSAALPATLNCSPATVQASSRQLIARARTNDSVSAVWLLALALANC